MERWNDEEGAKPLSSALRGAEMSKAEGNSKDLKPGL
jgi:hypothetical protein